MTTKIKAEIDPQAGTMELVQQAQTAYDAGRDREWAGILWTAAERAMRELAQSRGISGDSAVDILARLDSLDDRPRDGYFSNALGGVGMLRTHYRLGALESYWWEDLHTDTVEFIKVCHDAAR